VSRRHHAGGERRWIAADLTLDLTMQKGIGIGRTLELHDRPRFIGGDHAGTDHRDDDPIHHVLLNRVAATVVPRASPQIAAVCAARHWTEPEYYASAGINSRRQ
jgi:hypothetical protein